MMPKLQYVLECLSVHGNVFISFMISVSQRKNIKEKKEKLLRQRSFIRSAKVPANIIFKRQRSFHCNAKETA
jgi:hypothetical protein